MNASELYIFHVVGLALIAFSVGDCFKYTFCPNYNEIDMIIAGIRIIPAPLGIDFS